MISTLNSRLDDELLTEAEARGYDLKEIMTIASLIEKETDGTDQGLIASVIYNRLEGAGDKGGTYGLLQIDAALLYALPGHTGAITSEDLQTDSPYNLYKYAALPPRPSPIPAWPPLRRHWNPSSRITTTMPWGRTASIISLPHFPSTPPLSTARSMEDKRMKPELLAPAGDMERLRMAVLYGADEVYLAGTTFGMRAFAGNFTPEELREAVGFAHSPWRQGLLHHQHHAPER